MSMLRRSHLFGVDYFPDWAVRLITFAGPRFVSRLLINVRVNGMKSASVFMPTDYFIYAPLLSLTAMMTAPSHSPLQPCILYTSYRGYKQL